MAVYRVSGKGTAGCLLGVCMLVLSATERLEADKVWVRYSYKEDYAVTDSMVYDGREYLRLRDLTDFVGARTYFFEMPQRLVVSKGGNRVTFILGTGVLYVNGKLQRAAAGASLLRDGLIMVERSFALQVLEGVLGIPARWEGDDRQIVLGDPSRSVGPVSDDADGPAQQPPPRPYCLKKIIIDPGHGGYDSGAVGPTKYYEKTATLDIAARMKKLLLKSGFQVVMTREGDKYVSLKDRVQKANDSGADLFISIHCNASKSRRARGVETYIYSAQASNPDVARSVDRENVGVNWLEFVLEDLQHEAYKGRSNSLGIVLLSEFKKSLQLRDRRLEKGPFYVLAKAKMPAVLIEVGFISNREEEQKLKTTAFRQQVAEAVCRAIEMYKRTEQGKGGE